MRQAAPTAVRDRTKRLRATVHGAVQGVGFRPFVYRLATQLGLSGWVRNSPVGVEVDVEGAAADLAAFLHAIERDAPAPAFVQDVDHAMPDPIGHVGFRILDSDTGGGAATRILPDIAVCRACLADIADPTNRRYRYPFTNCTHCGPRYTIIERLPYDREHTTMRGFRMCAACEREYTDPSDRRFHAQPNACPVCGPRLAMWGSNGSILSEGDDALRHVVDEIRDGAIVAVKGLGGFQLIVDARNDAALRRLRLRKRRPHKPLAVMVPTPAHAHRIGRMSAVEERLLTSPQAPIVLLPRKGAAAIAECVAPGNPTVGIMLPYTPLHVLLLGDFGFPVVATSGNVADEPICIDESEAIDRLGKIADVFLVHDRPIARHADDSVARVVAGRTQVLRSARGWAPAALRVPFDVDGIVAVGGHLKSAVAVGTGRDLVMSQHIGDLDSPTACSVFTEVIRDLRELYETDPTTWAHDLHPDYWSSRQAAAHGAAAIAVQHHFAHVAAVLAEANASPPVAAVSWDGTGYGLDGSVWGGEFIAVNDRWACERDGHLRRFPLPGGEAAVREPWRAAIGVLYARHGERAFSLDRVAPVRNLARDRREILEVMLARGVNSPMTSSMGRLFDAVAAMLGLCSESTFEGQAAMALEHAADGSGAHHTYPFAWSRRDADGRSLRVLDWGPMIDAILDDLASGRPVPEIADAFHSTAAEFVVSYVGASGCDEAVLSGGCFQNRLLTERTIRRLSDEGVRVYWPQRVPPGDGGLCIGQAVLAALQRSRK